MTVKFDANEVQKTRLSLALTAGEGARGPSKELEGSI